MSGNESESETCMRSSDHLEMELERRRLLFDLLDHAEAARNYAERSAIGFAQGSGVNAGHWQGRCTGELNKIIDHLVTELDDGEE